MFLITYEGINQMKADTLADVRRWFDFNCVPALFQWLELEENGEGSSLCNDWHVAQVDYIPADVTPLSSYEWYEDMLIEIIDMDPEEQTDPDQLKMF